MKTKKLRLWVVMIPLVCLICTKVLGQGAWSNDNFIDTTFWSASPTDANIINALFGGGSGSTDKTAYTKYRGTMLCATGSMSVNYLTAGTSKLPSTLTTNKIYVLSGGVYVQTGAIFMENCSAIVGQGDVTIMMNTGVAGTTLVYSSTKRNWILDNVKLDRNYTGALASNSVITANISSGFTMNAIQVYGGGGSYGFYGLTSTYSVINNSQFYNNPKGIFYSTNANYYILTNSQIYNNTAGGIDATASSSGIIDNCQIYNNNGIGMYYYNGSSRNTLNNTQIYNNANGVLYTTNAKNNIMNNTQIYNNGGYGINHTTSQNQTYNNVRIYNNTTTGMFFDATSTGQKYYSTNKIFGNGVSSGGTVANLTSGASSDYPALSRSNGTIDQTNTVTRDYITNPKNSAGTYVANWSGTFANARGYRAFTATQPIQYSYGSGILTQQQAVIYFSGTTVATRETPTTTNFIGSSTAQITGNLLGVTQGINSPTNLTVTGSTNSSASKYNIFGDVLNYLYSIDSNTSTGIKLFMNNSQSYNRVVTQMYNPTASSAMHFERSTIREEPSNNTFVDSGFWNSNPTSQDIVSRFYGGGGGSTDKTAYTRYRNTNTCVPGSMSVIYLSGGGTNILPAALVANTIYVISGGTYINTGARTIANCSAIVGNGDVTIQGSFASAANLFSSASTKNWILDNLKLDRNYIGATAGNNTIIASSAGAFTINNIQAYGAGGSYGFNNTTSTYSQVNNSQFYNNKVGVFYTTNAHYFLLTNSQIYNNTTDGLQITSSSSGVIDNLHIYNNNGYGILYTTAIRSTLNNSQIYNNINGVAFATTASYNTINNSQIYNNTGYGINFSAGGGTNQIINNVWVYNNNTTGIFIGTTSTANKYYGANKVFSNGTVNIGGSGVNITTGASGDYPALGRTDGTINQTLTTTRDYITNPKNASGNYLLSWSGTFVSLRGYRTYTATQPMQYSFGSGILNEAQAIAYFSGVAMNPRDTPATANYIGSAVAKLTGSLIGSRGVYIPAIMSVRGITTSPATKYNIFGDVLTYIYNIDSNTATSITLSGGSITGRIVTEIYDPANYFATHFQTINTSSAQASVTYSYPADTTTIATLTGYTGLTIVNNGGLNTYTQTDVNTTTANLNFPFIVQDIYGNTGSVNARLRNNDNYIIANFWNNNPNDANIIDALYGDGSGGVNKTAYTKNRNTNTCVSTGMSVTYLSGGGTNLLPATLTANKIYALSGGTYIQTATINMSNCSAIIGEGEPTIQANMAAGGLINGGSAKYWILDGLKIDRNTSAANLNNILTNGASCATINNAQVYGAGAYFGMNMTNATYVTINNTQVYNNKYGMNISAASYYILSNSQVYNNTADGIDITTSTSGMVDNSQIYNNSAVGIVYSTNANTNALNNSQVYNNANGITYSTNSRNNIINNSQIYNNAGYGINYASGSNQVLNDTQVYNNNTTGVYIHASSLTDEYYGANKIFGNGTVNIAGTIANLTTGASGDYPTLGRIDGTIDQTPSTTRDYITNPKNASDNYLLSWSGTFVSLRGYRAYTVTQPMQYSFGSGTLTEKQAVIYYSGATITPRESPITTNYIGSSVPKVTGDLLGITQGIYNPTNISITASANMPATKYNVYGDIQPYLYAIDSNTTTGITFFGGAVTNRVVAEIYDPINYFATHFEKSTRRDNVGPNQVTLVSPADTSALMTGSLTLERSAATDTGIGLSGYFYQVATDVGFTNIVISNTKDITGVTLNGFTDGTYYRRVYAYDTFSNAGSRSTTRSFTVDTTTPIITFTGTTPADNARIQNNGFTAQFDIIESNLRTIKRSRSGVDYSIYDSGLILMMNFDKVAALGETSTLVKDLSLYGRDGTAYSGVTWTSNGKRNGGYIFDGVDDYIQGGIVQPTYFTISAWIKNTGIGTNFDGSVIVANDPQYYGGNIQYYLNLKANTHKILFMSQSSAAALQSNTILDNDQRYYITAVYDGAKQYIYINGVLDNSKVWTTNPVYAPSGNRNVQIGRRGYTGFPRNFEGSIDEVRIYNRALTGAEIATLYNSNINKYDTDKRLLTATTTGIANGTYDYTGTIIDIASSTVIAKRSITIDSISLLSPSNGSGVTTGNIYFLRSGLQAGSPGIGYNYEVSDDSGFSHMIITGTTTNTGIHLNGFTDGMYYRRVDAYDNAGATGGRSAPSTFTVDTVAPIITFSGSTPADNARLSTNYFTAQLDITESVLNQFRRSRSGVDYNLYDSGLILMMNFDKIAALGETDTNILDFSPYNNRGINMGGVTWTSNGKFGGAYQFDGTNDQVALANITKFNLQRFTISLRWDGEQAGTRGGPFNNREEGQYGFQFTTETSNSAQFQPHLAITNGDSEIGNYKILETYPFPFNRYIHFVRTYNGSGSPKCYVDGVEKTVYSSTATTWNYLGLLIGRGYSLVKGKIDEVRVYNRAITAGEVSLLYNSNLNKYNTDKWNFTVNVTGVTSGLYRYSGNVYDSVGNNYNIGRNIGQDLVAPSTPTLLSPSNGSGLYTNTIFLLRSGAIDDISGISGYIYQMSNDSGFTNIMISDSSATTGTTLTGLNDGTYYWRVYAYDNAGNTGNRSSGFSLTIQNIPVPIVGSGYISLGTTGMNAGIVYYKGTINIRAYLSGTNMTSCEYSTGGGWTTATTGATYCEATNLSPTNNINVQFRATNVAGATTGGSTTYIYDATAPTTPVLINPANGSGLNTGQFDLLRSGSMDIGIGLSGYLYEVSDDIGFSHILLTSFKTTTGVTLSGTDGTYYRRVYAYDVFGNIGSWSIPFSFTITTGTPINAAPIVGTGYISSGTLGTSGGQIYYKGSITIRASLSGTNISSCEYNIGSGRALANTGTDYCEATNLSPASDIDVQFRATNNIGTMSGGSTTYIYDATAPSTPIPLSPIAGAYINDSQVQLRRSPSSDIGIGVGGYYYEVTNNNGSLITQGITSTTGVSIFGLPDDIYNRRVYAYDRLGNVGNWSTTGNFGYTFAFVLTFKGIDNQSLKQKFSSVHFAAPGNNFIGGIFRLTTKSLTGNVKITLGGAEKNCNKQVRGMYFNSQRGNRIWPLDEYTLALLQQSNGTYDSLSISGGLYTSCDDKYSIFGEVTYNRSGSISELIAGTTMQYASNQRGGAFANSLQYFDNKTPIGYIFDSEGGIGFVGGNMNGHSDLVDYLNNGGTINDAFTQTGTNITSSTGSWIFTSDVTGNNATNTIRNILVQGTIGLSQSMGTQDRISLLGNPQKKSVIIGTDTINVSTIINQAKQNTEKLCKGKDRLTNVSTLPHTSNDNVLCFKNGNLAIDLWNDEPYYRGKTIIMVSGNVVTNNSMGNAYDGIDLFIDQGNLYLANNVLNLQSFDNQGYSGGTPAINSGTLLRGNIIINGLLIGGTPSAQSGYTHKLYVQGKISTLNTPFTPTTARIGFIQDILGAGMLYDNRIGLQNVFVRTCQLNGIGTDGTPCTDTSEISSIPLVITDGNYASRLLNR